MTLKTVRTHIGDDVTTIYSIDFDLGYINREYVYVYLVTDAYTLQLDYEWLNDTQIELTEVMPQGVSFNIRRIVPRNDIVNIYTNGAILREYYLNDSFRQALMLLEEVADGFIAADGELFQLQHNLDMNGFSITNLADLNMGGNSIINLPTPTDGTSPARLQDLEKAIADNGIIVNGNFPNATWEDNAGYTDTEIVNRFYPAGNVLRYGADPTGVADSTIAFNLATRGDGYSGTGIFDVDSFAGTVVVPAGYFKVSSAVWVHKGQHLKGEGEGGTNVLLNSAVNYQGAIFRLGRSSVQVEYPTGSGLFVDSGDVGGLPPEISGIWTYGGPASYPVIETSAAGASIHNMFLTACGTGIKIDGGDIRVNNIQIDICATGLVVGGRSNTITNVLIYVPNIAIATTMADGDTSRYLDDPSTLVGCSDIVFSNIQIFATKFYSTHLRQSNTVNIGSLGADIIIPIEHSDISFSNFKCQQNQFASNGYENFNSFILTECNEARNVVWTNCSFNNMNGPAIRHSTGVGNDFRFNSCTFDGRKTLGNFNQALRPSVCITLNDRMEFNNCAFKNLKDITNEVTLTIGGAVVGTWDPYEQLIVGPVPKIPFDSGIHTITYTGSPTHTAMFAQGSSGATEIIILGGTITNCLTNTATDSVFVRVGDTPSTSGLSLVQEQGVVYEDSSMDICNIPTVGIWYLYSDRYLGLNDATVAKVGGSKSTYKIDTTAGVSSIALPRIDANPKRDPKNGDILTFIDAEDTWTTNNVTFLAGDNFIDGGTSDFVASGNGSEVAFIYVADTNLAASPPKGNWISRVVPKSSLPLTGGTVEGDLTLVNSGFEIFNDAGNANPNFYRAHDATGGIGLGQNRARGTIAAPTALIDGDIVSGISALGHDGTAYKNSGGFRFKVAGAVSLGVVPMKLVLETSETNGVTERMAVMPDGKIGIGTTAPTALLTVAGNVNFSGLPTSSIGLASGDLWNNAGVLNII